MSDSDIDAWINEIKPAEASVDLCLRGDLLSQYDATRRQLDEIEEAGEPDRASLSDPGPAVKLRADLAGLREQMRASTKTFIFRALGDQAASDLLSKHPSPKDDKGVEIYAFNPQTYPVALVAACCVQPSMSQKQAEQLFDKLNLDQRNRLFDAAMRANNREVDIPFYGAGSAPAANTGLS